MAEPSKCCVCGRKVDVAHGAYRVKYCSIECWETVNRREMNHMDDGPPKYLRQTVFTRTCHDCGKPTDNYRCEECWAKIREDLDEDDTFESHPVAETYPDLQHGTGHKKGIKA